jgi:signal transduction histidine kinase
VGKVWQGEIINRRKDGALRTESMTITPLRDAKGEISHFIAIKQDITAQKTMETRFLQGQRMEAIGALAGGIAHDLNNVLSPTMLLTGLLKDKLTDESDLEILAMAHASAKRGANIIKQLLTYSRSQVGERSPVQPRHLIHDMIEIMRETFPRDLDIQQQLPVSLWTVLADSTQLHQVLMNLCVNARDAMPTGGRLTIEAANASLLEGDPKLPAGAKPGPYVVISVSDTGHGIPAEIRHRIFDPFFTTKPPGQGTGLGLSTVFGIVQNHGGFVVVDSTPQVGATFTVCLPATIDGAEAAAEVPLVPMSLPEVGQTILVVDDERAVRDGVRLILEQQHFQVIAAVDGGDALAQYLTHRDKISLVITDLMMPVEIASI